MSARQIEGYRRRLAKVAEKGADALTAECVGAVVRVREWGEDDLVGTLIAYTVRSFAGLIGPRVGVDVTVCTDCVGRPGSCGPRYEVTLTDVLLLDIRRNEDGVGDLIGRSS